MKRIIVCLYVILQIVVFFTSCSDYLDLAPRDKLSDEVFWKTPEDLEVYVNTLYQRIPGAVDNSQSDGWDTQIPLNRNTSLWGESVVPASGGGWANDDWSNIRACNYFMTRYQVVPGDNSQYVAEVRFFKAMFYFSKLCQFGEIPFYNRDLQVSDIDQLLKGRDSRSLVVGSILADLDYAIAVLPDKNNAVQGRLHKDVASALASRVTLYEGTWRVYRGDDSGKDYLQKCIIYSEPVMSNGYSIWKGENDPYKNYYRLFIQEDLSDNPEVIFYKKYDKDLNLTHNTTRVLSDSSNGLSRDFALSYLCTDGLPTMLSNLFLGDDSLRQEMSNRDPRMQQTIDSPLQIYTGDGMSPVYHSLPLQKNVSGYQLVKFHSPYFKDFDGNSVIDYPTFRYAEVLLNFAEAKAILGTLTNADLNKSINLIRDRVNMPAMTLENVNFEDPNFYSCGYSISNIVREIRRERRVELLGEGFRGDDIKRWKAGRLLENPKAFLGIKITQEMRDRYKQETGLDYTKKTTEVPECLLVPYEGMPTLTWNDKLYLSPLPKDQLTLNPNLVQNPGWED